MVEMNPHSSVITNSINGLNSPVKRQAIKVGPDLEGVVGPN